MALTRDAYRALEDVVGPGNISDDPVILDGYAFQFHMGIEYPPYGRFIARPAAVVLPENTEEVQRIVKVCNRHKVKVKAHSTGWGVWAGVATDEVIQVDLRRMNRVLEIDEENMLAVIEPYVIGAQLQAEAMKKGLNCNQLGAGSSCSVLASSTSCAGCGPTGLTMSYNNRNLLGTEWVLPSGELLKLGSLGSGSGWFCGEGPGPGLKGIARGFIGAMGGFGIFTRCAVKLYPWPGNGVMPVEGTTPNYRSPLPERFRDYTLAFSEWEGFADALYKISDSGIGYCLCKMVGQWGGEVAVPFYTVKRIDPSKTVDDLPAIMEDPAMRKLIDEMKISFQFTIAARSDGDLAYQEKVLREILKETNGHIVETFAVEDIQQLMHVFMIKVDSQGLVFDLTGNFTTAFGSFIPPDAMIKTVKVGAAVKQRYIDKGALVDDGAEAMWGCVYEQGLCGHFEEVAYYDPHDPKSCQGSKEYLFNATKENISQGLGPGGLGFFDLVAAPGKDRDEVLAGPVGPYLRWQRRIREAFDPNDISDPISYMTAPEILSK